MDKLASVASRWNQKTLCVEYRNYDKILVIKRQEAKMAATRQLIPTFVDELDRAAAYIELHQFRILTIVGYTLVLLFLSVCL